MFLMLNPSTADESANDPTVRKCESWARSWGFGRLLVGNIFAFRATDPKEMLRAPDPVGPGNNIALLEMAFEARTIVCAWGRHGAHRGRAREVLTVLKEAGYVLSYLRLNSDGSPEHPLYIPKRIEPTPGL